LLKAAFVASITSWKILEGVWALNHKPMPLSGAVLHYLAGLDKTPGGWTELTEQLFLGDADARIEAALVVMGWIITESELETP
jgi:hypothetical protein